MRDATSDPVAQPEPDDRTYLTADGRRLLEERIQRVSVTVAALQGELDDPEQRADSVEGYRRATQELARLRGLLERAAAIEDVPDDPDVVELGDAVSIRLDDGAVETYIVVHASEAPVEDQRISAQSPLGEALMGKHVGTEVEVKIPAGSYRCTILSASRVDANHAG